MVAKNQTYKNTQHKGFSDSFILVVGLVRNGQDTLRENINVIKNALSGCASLYWLIVESDSDDSTLDVLTDMRQSIVNFDFVSLGPLRHKYPMRTERIACCRNEYVRQIRSNSKYRDINYVAVADLDGINKNIDRHGVESCWDRNDWDVCTANQIGPYYDIWALRHSLWSPNDCWEQYRFLFNYSQDRERSLNTAVFGRMITISPTNEWIEVESAFGGFAVYVRDVFEVAEYVGVGLGGEEICEHVAFHSVLRQGGCRIFINPKLLNCGINEHTKEMFFFRKFKRKIGALAKRVVRTLPKFRTIRKY